MQTPPCKNSNCQCEERKCENRIIFTKPGKYIATAILLDPIVTSCNLRFSFFVKVKMLLSTDFFLIFDLSRYWDFSNFDITFPVREYSESSYTHFLTQTKAFMRIRFLNNMFFIVRRKTSDLAACM